MYRNCMQKRNCGCNMNETVVDPRMEQLCSNVINSYDDYDSCSCGFDEESAFPTNYMFGQSYVPFQTMNQTFRPCVGLKMGTIFPELVSPYTPGQSMREIEYLANNSIGGGCNGR